jgi:hypothetical protein
LTSLQEEIFNRKHLKRYAKRAVKGKAQLYRLNTIDLCEFCTLIAEHLCGEVEHLHRCPREDVDKGVVMLDFVDYHGLLRLE